eukprot:CAMPEP_0182518754 /NCGR_PEP_ID=MMETSP1321-20130603/44736_1 /TAXON_ID=91990 /ORGANISM="Bolidomonas sp., Strain RCC1657" /LENGTH=518 /DNA_ID=CAMNT_0024726695 /DNA_START=98 /DNA_END=1658 /DNA_ORIENTATION=-
MGNDQSSCHAKASTQHEDYINQRTLPPSPAGAPSALVDTSFDLSPDASDEDGFLEEDEVMINLSSEEEDTDSDSEEEDDYDFKEERRKVLADAKKMKEVVSWYFKPSSPIKVTTPPARCYFDRASSFSQETKEESDDRASALSDIDEMKEVVSWYFHPSREVKTSPYAFASAATSSISYLNESDPTAPKGIVDVEGSEEQEERRQALADVEEMKEVVSWYFHPSKAVKSSIASRCYFDRASAAPQETKEEADERAEAIAAAKEMGKIAQPVQPVDVHSTSFARCVFSNDRETKEEADERAEAIAAAKEMGKIASWWSNPSQPVEVHSTSFARCVFSNDRETKEEADERAEAIAAAKEMGKIASWWSNPSQPVEVHSTSFARCVFSNDRETKEEADERAEAIAAAKEMGTIASWWSNPSQPVSVDATACGRNYFTRPSALSTSEPIRTVRTRGESVMDMFDMDMSMDGDDLTSFVSSLVIDTADKRGTEEEMDHVVEKEGNLSRSPSSVALFGLGEEVC